LLHILCILLFSSTILTPPISTLFPYTTLFRSEVAVIADPLRLERRVALRRGKQLSVREVVDRLDRLRNAIFGDQEIVSIQAEDLIAARISHHGVDEDHIDIDLFTELRLLLRECAGGEEKTNCELL